MKEEIICIVCAVLGFAFVTFSRMQSMRSDFESNKQPFVTRKYFEKEGFGMIASLISIALWYFWFAEVGAKYPGLLGYKIASFIAFGAMGSWILPRFFGKTKGFIRKVMEVNSETEDQKQ